MSENTKKWSSARIVRDEVLPYSERSILPIQPVKVSELVGPVKSEVPSMHIGESLIYPFLLNRKGNKLTNLTYAAVVNHPLEGNNLLHFWNRIAPVKMDNIGVHNLDENDDPAIVTGDDWAFMVSPVSVNDEDRVFLEEMVHTPQNVPGIKQFFKYAPFYVDALNNQNVISLHQIPVEGRVLYPLMFVDITSKGTRWHDEVLSPQFSHKLLRSFSENLMKNEGQTPQTGAMFDTFSGMAIPAYADPSLTALWPKKHGKQEMSIAQVPVLNQQFTKRGYMNVQGVAPELTKYVLGSIAAGRMLR